MRKKLIATSVLIVLLFLYSRMETRCIFDPYIDTIFSEGFSQEKFESLEKGITKEQVISILGEPLYKHNSSEKNECWSYSTDGKLWPYADFSYFAYQVCFENELVESTPVYEFDN